MTYEHMSDGGVRRGGLRAGAWTGFGQVSIGGMY